MHWALALRKALADADTRTLATPQISLLPLSGGPHYGVSVLRVFCIAAGVLGEPPAWLLPRLRYDAALRRLLDALTHALTTLKELLLVAFLFILITAVVGHLFFASAATAEPATLGSATGFDTFSAALYTAFALMTGANVWQAPMWRAMRTGSAGAVIFFVAQELASILLMCLFNAALVRSFAVKEDVVRAARLRSCLHVCLHLTHGCRHARRRHIAGASAG